MDSRGGAATVVGGVVLTGRAGDDEPQLLSVLAVAVIVASAAWLLAGRLATWVFDLGVAVGHVLVAALIAGTGGAASPFVLLCVWQVVFVGYFLSGPRTAFQIVVCATALGVAFSAGPGGVAVSAWLAAVTTLLVVGFLVGTLQRVARADTADLRTVADTDPLTQLVNRRGMERAVSTGERVAIWSSSATSITSRRSTTSTGTRSETGC